MDTSQLHDGIRLPAAVENALDERAHAAPPPRHLTVVARPDQICNDPDHLKRSRARFEEWPAVATGCKEITTGFGSVLRPAAVLNWIGR